MLQMSGHGQPVVLPHLKRRSESISGVMKNPTQEMPLAEPAQLMSNARSFVFRFASSPIRERNRPDGGAIVSASHPHRLAELFNTRARGQPLPMSVADRVGCRPPNAGGQAPRRPVDLRGLRFTVTNGASKLAVDSDVLAHTRSLTKPQPSCRGERPRRRCRKASVGLKSDRGPGSCGGRARPLVAEGANHHSPRPNSCLGMTSTTWSQQTYCRFGCISPYQILNETPAR